MKINNNLIEIDEIDMADSSSVLSQINHYINKPLLFYESSYCSFIYNEDVTEWTDIRHVYIFEDNVVVTDFKLENYSYIMSIEVERFLEEFEYYSLGDGNHLINLSNENGLESDIIFINHGHFIVLCEKFPRHFDLITFNFKDSAVYKKYIVDYNLNLISNSL